MTGKLRSGPLKKIDVVRLHHVLRRRPSKSAGSMRIRQYRFRLGAELHSEPVVCLDMCSIMTDTDVLFWYRIDAN